MSTLLDWLEAGRRLAERIPYSIVALVARLAVASVFWRSSQTKVDGFFQIKDTTFFLFREEYKVPVMPPDLAASLATYQEIVFSVCLVIGLFSRLSAL
ncbi:MAG TPA: DoxX family protein, partial [Methyloceanibacter sp.]|nr:DoxX family protein [Methyloceanibacter sp.]